MSAGPDGIRARRFELADAAAWDDFVVASANGTLFHRRRFLGYHPPERFADHSLLLQRGERLLGVFPAARVVERGVPVLRSHPGASYGGLVVGRDLGAQGASELVRALLRAAGELGCRRIELRSAPRIFRRALCDELDYAYFLHGFRAAHCELSTCYDVARLGRGRPDAEAVLRTFHPKCRNQTRQALRHPLEARWCGDGELAEFFEVLCVNLEKHGARPTHSLEELVELRQRFPEEIRLLGVFRAGRMIAGILLFECNPAAMHCFYIAALPEHLELRPVNLAVLHAIGFAAERGMRWLNFGISTEEQGRVPNWGLFAFKEGFGGEGVLRTYWTRELGGEPG